MNERAPDGGPAARQNSVDPMLSLSIEQSEQRRDIQRLHDQQVNLASDLSEMGGLVAGTRDQIQALSSAVSELSEAVLGAQDENEDDQRPRPVDWWILDREQAQIAWDGLWTWTADYLVPTFLVTREELVDCWPRHRALRDTLAAMWVAQRAATDPQRARATADMEWQLRYQPEGMKRLDAQRKRLGCQPGKCRFVSETGGRVPEDGEITRPELWHRSAIKDDLAQRPEPEAQ